MLSRARKHHGFHEILAGCDVFVVIDDHQACFRNENSSHLPSSYAHTE